MVLVSFLGGAGCRRTPRDDHIDLEAHQLSREEREAIQLSLGPPILDDDVFALHIPKLPQTIAECLVTGRVHGRGTAGEES
jgi:hypothetical protein